MEDGRAKMEDVAFYVQMSKCADAQMTAFR